MQAFLSLTLRKTDSVFTKSVFRYFLLWQHPVQPPQLPQQPPFFSLRSLPMAWPTARHSTARTMIFPMVFSLYTNADAGIRVFVFPNRQINETRQRPNGHDGHGAKGRLPGQKPRQLVDDEGNGVGKAAHIAHGD